MRELEKVVNLEDYPIHNQNTNKYNELVRYYNNKLYINLNINVYS